MHGWPVNRTWHPWLQYKRKAMHPLDVQEVTPETLTPKKKSHQRWPQTEWANIATRELGKQMGPQEASKRKGEQQERNRDKWKTNVNGGWMDANAHQTKPAKQKETETRRGRHSRQSSETNEERQRRLLTKWWTHPPTTRLTHLCCIENPDNQLFRENWGYSLWRIAARYAKFMWLQDLQAMCGLASGNAALFVNCVDQKKLSAGRSQVPSWHMFGSSETWKHHKQSLQSVVWRKVEEWL